MLKREPGARPTAEQLLSRVTGYDIATTSRLSLFGDCCANKLVPRKEFEKIIRYYNRSFEDMQIISTSLREANKSNSALRAQVELLQMHLSTEQVSP